MHFIVSHTNEKTSICSIYIAPITIAFYFWYHFRSYRSIIIYYTTKYFWPVCICVRVITANVLFDILNNIVWYVVACYTVVWIFLSQRNGYRALFLQIIGVFYILSEIVWIFKTFVLFFWLTVRRKLKLKYLVFFWTMVILLLNIFVFILLINISAACSTN